MASADVLAVMARQPVPGAVKTRMAARLGAARTGALYRAFLADIAADLGRGPWALRWAVTPAAADLRPVVGADAVSLPQRGRGLGERMHHCFADLLAAGARRVVMIGADLPHIGVQRVAAAFAALDAADVVLVPTREGGYGLIGMGTAHDVFAGVAVGGPHAFAQTVRRAATLGLRPNLQPGTFRIDDWSDVERLRTLLDIGVACLPATAAVLAALG